MNHPHPGSLATYNSLTDRHLTGYFSNARIRRHLQRSGLISRSGRILSEKEYRLNAMRKDHQKYIRECLAQAIFHKVLDMEQRHQVEIKRKLESSARKERVQRLKVEQSRRSAEDPLFLLSPHPPTAPRNRFGRHRLGDRGQPGHSATHPRPSTAPGNIQHPVRLQPIYNNATTESTPKATSSSRSKFSPYEKEHHFASVGERGVFRTIHSVDFSSALSPYRLPIINNYVIPVPPPPPAPKSDKNTSMRYGTSRGRRFRPTTAPNGLEQLLVKDTGKFYKPQVHSNAYVSMIYLGKSVHLSHDLFDYRDEIKIYQQHCGGENVCVYKGKLLEGETFQFISRRHHGFPFSLTFYLNGMQVDRLSSCCEYKHRKGTRLGGKHGHFGFVNVERSSPCYRCIIAMGLDKQPSPPKKKVTDENEEKKDDSRKDDVNHKLSETSSGVGIGEENKNSVSQSSSVAGEGKESEEMEVETTKDETRSDDYSDERERNQRCTSDNAYDEDFEADEEKSDEKVNEEGQADDQMNGMSKSPSDDEKDNLDHEKESKNSSQKALQAFDSEQDESDGYSESDLEEDKQDRKRVPSLSPSSTLYSSDNDSESDTRKQDDEKDNTDIHSEYEHEVTETQREKGHVTDAENEEERSKASNTEAQNAPGHKTRVETDLHYMTPVNEKLKLVGSQGDTREDRDNVSLEAEHRSKESSEDEREGDCKSVKEKIAEAFGNDPFLSSEPEPSDSSTEDEEENITATQDKHEVSDGVSLADEELTKHRAQKIVEHEAQERQMVGKDNRALEEEEVRDEAAALEEEFLAKNAATIIAEQKVEEELETELEASAADESDLEIDNVEKTITHEKEQLSDSEEEMKEEDEELERIALTDVASKGDDTLHGYQLQREQVEYPHFTEGSLVFGKVSEGTEEAVEAAEMVGTGELVQKRLMTEETLEAMEPMKEIVEADETLGAIFVQRDYVEETLTTMEEGSEGSQSLKEREPDAEAIEKGSIAENETMEDMFWKEDEHIEEERFIKTEDCFWTASGMEVDPKVFRSREAAEMVSADEKATSSEESIDGGNCFKGEVPIGVEKKVPLMFEVELEKTSAEAREMNKTIEEDSEREKAESWLEEPLMDWETEGNISAIEEENKKDQGENLTVEEWETSGELITGREATIKAMVKANETAHEEDSLVQDVEEDTGGAEEITASEEAGPERKLVMEKEILFPEEPIKTVPEASALVAEETTRRAGKVEPEEAERTVAIKREVDVEEIEGEVSVKGEVYAEEAEGEVAVKWEEEEEAEEVAVKEEVEAEEADGAYREVYAEEAEKEVAVKGEEEAEGEVKGEMEEGAEGEVAVKGEVEEETEGEVAVKSEVEEEIEGEVADKEKVEAEEAEEEVDVKGEVQEEIEREVAVKEKVEAEEAEEEVGVKGEVQEEIEREVAVKEKVEAEEAEEEVDVKGEVQEEIEREVAVKEKVEAEEAEEEVDVKGEVQEEIEREVAVKEEVETEEEEEEVDVKGEVQEEIEREVAVKEEVETDKEEEVDVKGEVQEEIEREVAVKEEVETEEVAVKGEVEEEAERVVAIKGDIFAEEAEREVIVKGEVDVENAEREIATKEEVEAEEVEREVTVKGEMEVEDPETQGEVVSVDIGTEGKIVSEMTVMGRENVVNILGEKVAEAEQMPESSAREVALEGERLTQEKRMMNEPTIQDEVEIPSEETAVERSIDLQMKKEEVDLDERITEEQMIEGVISLQVVEEALLIGIQQLITDVSQLNVGVDDKEELEMEGLAEDKSSYENPMKEERLEDVVAKERKIAQGDEADQRGTEHGKEIHLERKDGRGNKKIEAGDYPVENLLWTETIPLSAPQFGIEQQHELSAQIINLEPAGMSDPKDEH